VNTGKTPENVKLKCSKISTFQTRQINMQTKNNSFRVLFRCL